MPGDGRGYLPVVAGVLPDALGRVLLARRLPGGPHGGLWEFPGGKVEAGESAAQALARELREELGVEVAVGDALASVDHAYPHLAIRLTAFWVQLRAGVPRPLHCQQVRWVAPAEFSRYPMPAADLPIARRLAAGASPG